MWWIFALAHALSPSQTAIAKFRSSYAPGGVIKLPKIFTSSPVPENSMAGREFAAYKSSGGRKLSETPDEDLAATFEALAELYGGDDKALEMVEAVPRILAFEASKLAATKASFVANLAGDKDDEPAKYTEADVVAMIQRNPLLSGVPATGYGSAEACGEETMYASYVVAATRPLGPVLLFTLIALVLSPFVKKALGLL